MKRARRFELLLGMLASGFLLANCASHGSGITNVGQLQQGLTVDDTDVTTCRDAAQTQATRITACQNAATTFLGLSPGSGTGGLNVGQITMEMVQVANELDPTNTTTQSLLAQVQTATANLYGP